MTTAQARRADDRCLCCNVHGEQAPPGSDKVAARHAAAPAAEPPPSPTAELHLAAADGDETLVRELLAAGADLELADSNGERPLHAAASSGQAGCLRLLLQAGADTEAADAHGHTAVHWAAAAGQEGCLRVLIEHGAQLERRDCNGLTPLALAAGKNQLGCLYALLAAGALPSTVCCLGNSALHVAACNGSLQAIRCLAAAGVPLTARNRLGQTPRQVAVHYRQGSAECLLRQLERQQQRGKGFSRLSEHGHPPSRPAVLGAAELAAAASAADAAAAQLLEDEEREAAQRAARQAAKAARRQRQRARQQQAAGAARHGGSLRGGASQSPQAEGQDAGMHGVQPLAGTAVNRRTDPADMPRPEQPPQPPSTAQPTSAAAAGGTEPSHDAASSLTLSLGIQATEQPGAMDSFDGTGPQSHGAAAFVSSGPATEDPAAAPPSTPTPAAPTPFPAAPAFPCCCTSGDPPALTHGPALTACLGEDLLCELRCPITQEPMQDPVLAADGQTYDREAIQAWIARQAAAGLRPCSPLTNLPLRHTELHTNHVVRKLVCGLLAAGLLD